ncbi:hypothetical protein MUNTM_38800 [Mycobacterium sp. MUNTM1]
MSTPADADIDESVKSLQAEWDLASRTGRPRIVVLDMHKPDRPRLSRWADLGVCEVAYGLPDKSTDEVEAHLTKLSDRLDSFGSIGVAAAR